MSTVEEVTEARIATLTGRIGEMRDHMDQAGLRLQAAEAQLQAGGNMSGRRSTDPPMPQSSVESSEHVVEDDLLKQLELSAHQYELGESKCRRSLRRY